MADRDQMVGHYFTGKYMMSTELEPICLPLSAYTSTGITSCGEPANPCNQLPAYDPYVAAFLEPCLNPQTFGMVCAVTGTGKSGMLANMTAYALLTERPVLVCALERSSQVERDITLMLADLDYRRRIPVSNQGATAIDRVKSARALMHRNLRLADLSKDAFTAKDVISTLQAEHINAPLLVVDGLDRLDIQGSQRLELAELLSHLAVLAESGTAVWTTSQAKAEAVGRELITPGMMAFAPEKGHRPTTVLTLGNRLPGMIWTACIAKDRDASTDKPSLYRYGVSRSRRMVMGPSGVLPCRTAPSTRYTFEFIGPSGDMPGAADSYDGAAPAVDSEVTHIEPVMRPYHGTKGFIQISRRLFESPTFANRNADDVFHLMDLASMTQIMPSTLQLPGTTVKVKVDRIQVLTSLRQLQQRWNLPSDSSIRRLLRTAEAEKLITVEHLNSDGTPARQKAAPRNSERNHGRIGGTLISCNFIAPPKEKETSNERNA